MKLVQNHGILYIRHNMLHLEGKNRRMNCELHNNSFSLDQNVAFNKRLSIYLFIIKITNFGFQICFIEGIYGYMGYKNKDIKMLYNI